MDSHFIATVVVKPQSGVADLVQYRPHDAVGDLTLQIRSAAVVSPR
jgi:hypothetical protein